MRPRGRSLLPLLLCAAACSTGPPLRTYVLTPPFDQTAPTPPTSLAGDPMTTKQRLEVRRILVPDYLDSTDILMRSGTDEVKASATGRWGERLSLGLTRALGADLAARMPQYSVVQDGSSNAQRQLRITINALDLWQNGRCVLAADWSIVDQDSAIPMISGSGTFDSLNAGGATTVTDASLVEAVARTLGKLADRIVPDAQAKAERADARRGSKVLSAE
jgi:cholesterol transport system auxiliary component